MARTLVQARRLGKLGRSREVQRAFATPTVMQEAPGRPVGQPEGSWIDELSSRHTAIVLCDIRCRSRFDHKQADYYMDRRFPYVSGQCDGCRQIEVQCRLYIHNSFLSEPNGRIQSGQVWTPA
jgi:hypothetical protein